VIKEKLAKYGDEINFPKHYLINFIAKYYKNLISYDKNGIPCEPYCKIDAFKEVLGNEGALQIQKDKLLIVFELDNK